jgi:hypothetical protein
LTARPGIQLGDSARIRANLVNDLPQGITMPARRLACLAVLPILATSAVLLPAGSAQAADTAGCVTKAEYKKAKKGMKQTRVHGIFDTNGKRESRATSGGYVAEIRSYKACGSPYSNIAIAFDKNPGAAMKLTAKSAVWVD